MECLPVVAENVGEPSIQVICLSALFHRLEMKKSIRSCIVKEYFSGAVEIVPNSRSTFNESTISVRGHAETRTDM